MKNFYKMSLALMMMLFAVAANADVKTLYSWESPEGTVSETGGTIAYVNGDGDRLNYVNGVYHTICLNGKSGNLADATASANAGHMVITFTEALKAGDKISVTAYKSKGDATKKACIYMLFKEDVTLVGEDSFNDLLNGTEPSGLEPNTVDYIVPAEADGCTTLTLTRDKNGASTNLFITKLVITREESETVQEIAFNKMTHDPYDEDIDYMYENTEWVARFDVITGIKVKEQQQVEVGKVYTVTDLDPAYSYLTPAATRQDKTTRYAFEEVSLVFTDQTHMEATVTAKKGDEVIKAHLTYADVKELTLNTTGKCEYFADMTIFDFLGKTNAEDYTVEVAIVAESLEAGKTYTESDMNKFATKITTPMGEEKFKTASLVLSETSDSYTLAGDVVSVNDVTYHITLTTNKPDMGEKTVEISLGENLSVSMEDGEVKLKALNGEYQLLAYLNLASEDALVTGTYDIIEPEYSKFGELFFDDFYMLDVFTEGKVAVVNEGGVISITATFKQNGKNYIVTASTPAAPGEAEELPLIYNVEMEDYGMAQMWKGYDKSYNEVSVLVVNGEIDLSDTYIYTDFGFGTKIMATSGTGTVTTTETGSALDATVTFENGKTYHITAVIETVACPLDAPESVKATTSAITVVFDAEGVSDKQAPTLDIMFGIKKDGVIYYMKSSVEDVEVVDGKFTVVADLNIFVNTEDGSALTLSEGDEVTVVFMEAQLYEHPGGEFFDDDLDFDNVTVTVEGSTGINDATLNSSVNGKFVKNGKIVIVKNGKQYNVNGAQVK